MNSTEEQTAAALRSLVEQGATATTAPPGLARLVLDRTKRRRTRVKRAATTLGVTAVATIVAAASLTGSGDYREWIQPSDAMAPTVDISQAVTLNTTLTPQRGDVVAVTVIDDGYGQTFELLSRVIGLPDDTVECPATKNGTCDGVVVSGEQLHEPWIITPTAPFSRTAVPEGRVFLLGDARDAARDSREIGLQHLDEILGVAVARVTGNGPRQSIPGTAEHKIPERGDPVDPADPIPPS
jgi:signal peptidase I